MSILKIVPAAISLLNAAVAASKDGKITVGEVMDILTKVMNKFNLKDVVILDFGKKAT